MGEEKQWSKNFVMQVKNCVGIFGEIKLWTNKGVRVQRTSNGRKVATMFAAVPCFPQPAHPPPKIPLSPHLGGEDSSERMRIKKFENQINNPTMNKFIHRGHKPKETYSFIWNANNGQLLEDRVNTM